MRNTKSKNGANNPFYAIEIGSVIKGDTGRFQASVIKGNITRMIPDKDVKQSMTGVSSYVYNDRLNQGFAGVSGAYGISGLASINSGLSIHTGNSAAELTKEVQVNYNVQMISGVEYINFNDLQADDLINSLQGSPKDMALEALEKYNTIMEKIGTTDLLTTLKDAKKDSEIVKLVGEWVSSVQDFFREHGDGIVVGVVWGGIGTVSLKMNNVSTENSWKYGSKGNFTYAGVGKAITIEAAYDGSNSNRESEVRVSTKSWFIGNCVEEQVDKWSQVVQGKAFSEISSIDLLQSAPSLGDVESPPKVPDFKTPAKDPKVTDKIKEITSLDGLEAFAKASAYEKAKERDSTLTLDEFLKRSREDANPQNVRELQDGIAMNDLDVLADDVQLNASFKKIEQLETSTAEKAKAVKKDSGHTVLGIWIANWPDLFPWMATGYLNEIDDISSTREIIKKQCMIQDFLTLAKTYYMLQATGISNKDFKMSDFVQIADSFSQQAGYIRSYFNDHDVIQRAYGELSPDAQKIYKKWNDIKFLRSAELGLGVIYKEEKSIKDTIIKMSHVDNYTRVWHKTDDCSFLPANSNYGAFSSFLKVVPFITPAGDIYAFGPSQMILNQINDEGAIFSRNPKTAAKLEVDAASRTLKSEDVIFYPVPFKAAKDIPSPWKGQSVSTNVASIKSIEDHLEDAKKAMKDLNVYSFSSSNWKPNWKPKNFYSISSIKMQYIGLVDEIRNIFFG